MILLVLGAVPAGAHTEFQSSDPADGAVVTGELDRITVTFTAAAEPAGEGFVVLDSSGIIREPDSATSVDGTAWILTFSEPLPTGDVGVRWTVQAPDAHPIEGSFRFVVAPPPSTPQPEPAVVDAEVEAAGEVDRAPPLDASELPAALDEFLETGTGPARVDAVARASAIAAVVGALVAGAVVSFLLLVLGGSLRLPLGPARFVMVGAALVVVGAMGALVAQVALLGGSWSELTDPSRWTETLGRSFGIAVATRLLGGALLLWWGRELERTPTHARNQVIPVGVGAQSAGVPVPTETARPVGADKMGPAIGAVLILVSFAFDGHTVSEGPRALHGLANVAHVGAGAVWLGGAGMLAWLSRRPLAIASPLSVAAARFSVVATGAVVAVGLTGTVMAVFILGGPTDLWQTGWGRVLLGKLVAVAVIGLLGAHNHRVVVPGLQERPDDAGLLADLRRTTLTEAGLFATVLVLTGILVMADAT